MEKHKPLILNPSAPVDLERAGRVFRSGGIIAYPTETFYGLCVDPFNDYAIRRLFFLKGRHEKNPVALIIADKSMLKGVAREVTEAGARLMERFWPGPLTLIFRAAPEVPQELTGFTGKIGVRVSSHPIARALSEAFKSPITATSANHSGEKPATEAGEVLGYFDGSIDILIDGGKLSGTKGSTVVDVTGERIELIREGEVEFSEVMKALE